eukprot:TRINITY_DN995_c0_g3_i2.p1 TRINITY_DN995_c0_g3~~TRINITY_DN995_c0_g3_i2.p1  ORF type:complete len:360 (-),score=31.48 TRINITY_DN995_c0_g3_i2:171-1250(-)
MRSLLMKVLIIRLTKIESWMTHCKVDFRVTRLLRRNWRETYILLHHWRHTINGVVYGEFWGCNRYENSFRLQMIDNQLQSTVMYDPSWICQKCEFVRTVTGREVISFWCGTPGLAFEYAMERVLVPATVKESAMARSLHSCERLALYLYSAQTNNFLCGQLYRGSADDIDSDEHLLNVPYFDYAGNMEIRYVFPAFRDQEPSPVKHAIARNLSLSKISSDQPVSTASRVPVQTLIAPSMAPKPVLPIHRLGFRVHPQVVRKGSLSSASPVSLPSAQTRTLTTTTTTTTTTTVAAPSTTASITATAVSAGRAPTVPHAFTTSVPSAGPRRLTSALSLRRASARRSAPVPPRPSRQAPDQA